MRYSTTFPNAENPISQGGAWHHNGTFWTLVRTAGNEAFGTQTGTGNFDDSYAYLGGFQPDVDVSATIFKDPAIDGSTTHEVEIFVRFSDDASNARGYECNLAFSGAYGEVVRWNGGFGSFTYVTPQGSGGGVAPVTGDIFRVLVVGNLITTFLNGVVRNSCDISSIGGQIWTSGNPGMGFFRNAVNASPNSAYGFTSYTASDGANPLQFGAGTTS